MVKIILTRVVCEDLSISGQGPANCVRKCYIPSSDFHPQKEI